MMWGKWSSQSFLTSFTIVVSICLTVLLSLLTKPSDFGLNGTVQEFTKVGNKVWLEFSTLIRMQTPGDPKSTDKLFHQHISDCRSSVIFQDIGFSPFTKIISQNKDIHMTILCLGQGTHNVKGNALKGSSNRHSSQLSSLSPRAGRGHGTGITALAPSDNIGLVSSPIESMSDSIDSLIFSKMATCWAVMQTLQDSFPYLSWGHNLHNSLFTPLPALGDPFPTQDTLPI